MPRTFRFPSRARRAAIALAAAATLAVWTAGALAQTDPPPLRRRAWSGARIAPPDDSTGAPVVSVEAGSPAARAGLRPGDRVVRLRGEAVADPIAFGSRYRALRAGDTLRVRVVRPSAGGGRAETLDLAVPLGPLPEERIPGAEVTYGSVVTDRGLRLRTIVTRPAGARGRLPGVLLVGWLSCSSVEIPVNGGDGIARVSRAIASRSGAVFLRVDKPGVGDSDGDCARADLTDDLAGYRAALAALRARPDVDSTRIFVLGASIGAALAPFVAQWLPGAAPVRGLIVTGGFAKTWYEHMLEIERRRFGLLGRTPAEIDAAMGRVAELYTEYLIRKRLPGDVIREHPELAAVWDEPPTHQYGRPAAFYHQVQALNVAEAWSRLSAPVLILHGEYDWIMSRDDQDIVLDIANGKRPGSARLVILPKTNHDLDTFPSLAAAFQGENSGYDPAVERIIIDWLRRQAAHAAPR